MLSPDARILYEMLQITRRKHYVALRKVERYKKRLAEVQKSSAATFIDNLPMLTNAQKHLIMTQLANSQRKLKVSTI